MAKKTRQTDAVINLQKNLKAIRVVFGLRLKDVGQFIGLTSAAIHAIEQEKRKMSIAQYIAIRHMLDYEVDNMDDPEKQYRCKKVVALLVDNAEYLNYDWTEELIRQLTEEEE